MQPAVTFIDLEFDTIPNQGMPLGDVAASLVCLHDLLRDLATLAGYPSSAEFREIQVVAIEMRSPLTIKLSLLAISADAVRAFQEICRDVIRFREDAARLANIDALLERVLPAASNHGPLTETEKQRLHDHIVILQNAAIPLRRVVVRAD